MVSELFISILLIAGALFMLFASIGILRLPDVYTRMHATTKSASLGILLVFTGASLAFTGQGVWLKAIISIIFIFLTVPIASHMIGRVAHMMKIPKWEKTIQDDLEDKDEKPVNKSM